MKSPRFGLGLIFAATVALATHAAVAASQPEWRGVMALDTGTSFLVVAPGETAGTWKKVGDPFGDWTVVAYRETDRTLVVQRANGTKLDLVMNASPATAANPAAQPPSSLPVVTEGGMAPANDNATRANAFAVKYLQERATQLGRDEEKAQKAFQAYKDTHAGLDPSQMSPGPVADEGNSLKTQAAVAHQNYVTILNRLAETERVGIQGAAAPPADTK